MTRIHDILKNKTIQGVHSISPEATVVEAAHQLKKHNVGALIVIEKGKPVGIISERDIARKAQEGASGLENSRVSDAMTRDVIIGIPEDDISYVTAIMIRSRIRHLPVVVGREIVGVVSIGDVLKAQLSDTQFENRMLHDYIDGKYPG